ncbi:hypothetical protein FXO37_08830 [Capsicum annuum]|nr:hypothetical protein FXO37_08830 [Capsicum annuum]
MVVRCGDVAFPPRMGPGNFARRANIKLLLQQRMPWMEEAFPASSNLVQTASYGGEVLLNCWKLKNLLNDERPSQEDNQEDESDDDSDA